MYLKVTVNVLKNKTYFKVKKYICLQISQALCQLHLRQNNYEHALKGVFLSFYQCMLAATISVSRLYIRHILWTSMQDFTLFHNNVWKTDSIHTYNPYELNRE